MSLVSRSFDSHQILRDNWCGNHYSSFARLDMFDQRFRPAERIINDKAALRIDKILGALILHDLNKYIRINSDLQA